MIYHLFYPLSEYFFIFNVTRYLTFRGGFAFLTSFLFIILLWKPFMKWLRAVNMVETIDMYGHVNLEAIYASKKGTPTMGGILIIFAVAFSVVLWARIDNYFVWLTMYIMFALGFLGLRDDMLKTKTGKGLSRKEKFFGQIIIGLVLGILIFINKEIATTWDLPFLKKLAIDLGYFYIFWAALIVVATSNAVNFTDGLDGLAIGSIVINALLFAFLSYIVGNIKYANYLFVPYVPGVGELAIFCFALVGAGLGFLWHNAHPAEIFMGDVGALSLGGVLGTIALLIKKEFLLVIAGGLFVMEAMCVILQMISIKVFKKRMFKAAPFHHHLQLLGWKESKIIVRLWIVAIICAVASLLTLKLR